MHCMDRGAELVLDPFCGLGILIRNFGSSKYRDSNFSNGFVEAVAHMDIGSYEYVAWTICGSRNHPVHMIDL